MSSLYKLLWAVADSRVFRSTVIYQVTEGVTWNAKHAFDKGCAFQEPTSGVTEKASGHQALKRGGAVGTKQDRVAGKGRAAGPRRG